MEFSAFFTDANGVPALGLTPLPVGTIKATDGTVVAPQNLAEVGLGWYTYDFTVDNAKNYVGHAYASSQPAGARYAPLATTVQGEVEDTLEDTSTTIPDQLDVIQTETDKIQTIDDNVDLILEDTSTTIPDQLDLIQTETDKIPTILATVELSQIDIDFIKNIEGGKWELDGVLNQMVFYKADNITEVARFDMFAGLVPSVINVTKRERV